MGKKKSSKHERRLPDRERWYQLVGHFDDAKIEATPIRGAFFRGALDKTVIVEVEKDFPEERMGQLAKWLEDKGIESMVVSAGIRFLKLRPATKDQNAVLEAHYEEANKPPPPEGPPEPKFIPEAFEGRSV